MADKLIEPQEYSALRGELVGYFTQTLQLLTFTLAATTGGIAWSATTRIHDAEFLPLVPLIFLLPTMSLCVAIRQNIMRVASYLRVCACPGFMYEKRLETWRIRNRGWQIPWVTYRTAIFSIFLFQGAALNGVAWYFHYFPPTKDPGEQPSAAHAAVLCIFTAGTLWMWFRFWRKYGAIDLTTPNDKRSEELWTTTTDEVKEVAKKEIVQEDYTI